MIDVSTLIAFLPMLAIPFVIIGKIMAGEKFNNTVFNVILAILILLSLATLSMIFYMVQPTVNNEIYTPFIHKINYPLGIAASVYFSLLNKILLIFYGILFIFCVVKYIQTKDFALLKRFGVTSLFVGILLVFALPTFCLSGYKVVAPDYESYINMSKNEIEKGKLATKLCILPAMKAFYAKDTATNISLYLHKQYSEPLNIPNYSSKEAQDLIDEYIKYQEYCAKTTSYIEYVLLSLNCLSYERFDQALYYAQIAKNYEYNAQSLISAIYIAKGEYQKALEYIDPNNNHFSIKKKLVAIYIGLGEFDKAEDIINKTEDKKTYIQWKPQAKIYLNYKKGNKKIAQNLFEEYKKTSNKFKSYSLEEFIQYNDRIDY